MLRYIPLREKPELKEAAALVDEVEATHIGCEYGEYDHKEPY